MARLPQQDQVTRIPLVGTEFSRTLATSASTSTASGTVGVGVVGTMIVGYSVGSLKDQRFVNAIPEKITNPLTGTTTFYVNKRPGFGVNSTPASGNVGSAVHVWSGKSPGSAVISAFGATNSTVYNATSSLGATTGKVLFINDTLVSTTPNLTFVTDLNNAYYYPDAGALTQITDVDFPGNAGETITGNFAFLDGYSFIMTTSGKVYNSDLNSLSAWSALSFISANMSPDTGIGLARYKDQIIAFGSQSTEFFQDVGNPTGSPLQRTSQGFINIGCVNQKCYVQLDDTVVWLGSTENSGLALYMLDGLQAKRVSTPVIEAILAATSPANLNLSAVKLVGKSLVAIVSTSDRRTYLYCIEDNMWHEWSGNQIYWQFMSGIAFGVRNIYAVTEQNTSGKVYVITPTAFVYQDDGNNYTFLVQTSRWDNNSSKNKFLSKLRLVGDIQPTSTVVGVAWSDDDYVTTTTARNVDMANNNTYMTGLGSFRRRSFSLTNSTNGPLRLEALELTFREGLH